MIYSNSQEVHQSDVDFVDGWFRAHKREFNKIVRKCKEAGTNKTKNYYMVDLVSKAIWDSDFRLSRRYSRAICSYVQKLYPKWFIEEDKEDEIDNQTILQFMKFLQTGNLRVAS